MGVGLHQGKLRRFRADLHDEVDYFFTARGRIGIAANNILFYGTGGYAHGG